MLDLVEVIDTHTDSLASDLREFPDARVLVLRLRSVLAGQPAPPWFPMISFEMFLRGVSVLEESVLARMGWEVEPDPVVRANARSCLRTALAKLARLYAAGMDREMSTIKARQRSLRSQLGRDKAILDGLQRTCYSALAVIEADGCVVTWNEAAARTTGISELELVGSSIGQLIPAVGDALERLVQRKKDESGSRPTLVEGTCRVMGVEGKSGPELSFRLSLAEPSRGPRPPQLVLSLARGSTMISSRLSA